MRRALRRTAVTRRSGQAGQPARPGPRRGFTLVEVLLVSAVVSIVARIAVPNVNHLVTRARAAEVMGDISVVRTAAYSYLAEHHQWPPDAEPGVVPEGLRSYLGEGVTFEKDGYTLDWENWRLPDGLPSRPDVRFLTGVSVIPERQSLADALLGLLGPSGWFVVGEDYVFLLEPE